MIAFPFCKINLGLSVLRKRQDGYHDIETCFYPVSWTDIVEVIPSEEFSFTTSGALIAGMPEDNLCVKAFRQLQRDFSLGAVSMHLHKVIPAGAGLGGGSSDAAHVLLLLNEIFSLSLTQDQLFQYAMLLGSDCPFFIQHSPMIGSGRGEILEPVQNSELSNMFLVLVKPDVHVSTAEAFAGITPGKPMMSVREVLSRYPVEQWKDKLVNDFERSVFLKHPVIGSIKEKLYSHGALYASMSGSGSAVFGIFSEAVDLAKDFEEHLVWQGQLSPG